MEILIFGQLREVVGQSVIHITDVTDTASLNQRLREVYPGITSYTYRIAVDGKMINGNVPLFPGSAIALLPPFSGG